MHLVGKEKKLSIMGLANPELDLDSKIKEEESAKGSCLIQQQQASAAAPHKK